MKNLFNEILTELTIRYYPSEHYLFMVMVALERIA